MANYREIAQEYARGGIKAAMLINGAASIALLSQLGPLQEIHKIEYAVSALSFWAVGVICAAVTWLFAFFSAMQVGNSQQETDDNLKKYYLMLSNSWVNVAIFSIMLSFVFFAAGCARLAAIV